MQIDQGAAVREVLRTVEAEFEGSVSAADFQPGRIHSFAPGDDPPAEVLQQWDGWIAAAARAIRCNNEGIEIVSQQTLFDKGSTAQVSTSEEARPAESVAVKLRRRALAFVASESRGATPDEAAEELGRTVLTWRPRFSELKKAGYIYATGDRRRNSGGKRTMVYMVTAKGLAVLRG